MSGALEAIEPEVAPGGPAFKTLLQVQCEVLGWIDEIAAEMKIWCIQVLGNVLGDDKDIKEMSWVLGARPLLACASGVSRVRRPRLYWSNAGIEDHGFSRSHYELYDEIVL